MMLDGMAKASASLACQSPRQQSSVFVCRGPDIGSVPLPPSAASAAELLHTVAQEVDEHNKLNAMV